MWKKLLNGMLEQLRLNIASVIKEFLGGADIHRSITLIFYLINEITDSISKNARNEAAEDVSNAALR